jgi:hypothetical protein
LCRLGAGYDETRIEFRCPATDVNLASDLPVRVVGDADAARLRDPLKTRGDIDSIAEDIVVVDDDVADVNADAEFDPEFLQYIGVLPGHATLNFDGASRCINGTGKLDQHAVASCLDDASAMFGDCGIDERLSERLELRKRAFLIAAHQTAIAGDIRR